jgi:hypothetical protein
MREAQIHRVRDVIFTPQEEFSRIANSLSSTPMLLLRYVIPLALLTAISTVYGMNHFDSAWDVSQGFRVPKERILGIGIANFGFEIVSVLLIGAVFFVLTGLGPAKRNLRAAMNVAIYGALPLLIAGPLMFMPINVIICVFAMLHCFVLYWIGVQRVLRIPAENAAVFVALSMTITFGASTLMGSLAAQWGLL